MKEFILLHLIILGGLGLLVAGFYTTHKSLSFFAGGLAVTLNILFLSLAYHFILNKKVIVLFINIIIFKYALIGWGIYLLISNNLIQGLFFGFGVGSLVISCLFYGFIRYIGKIKGPI